MIESRYKEVELKLHLGREVFDAMLQNQASSSVANRQENFFFDDDKQTLCSNLLALRMRFSDLGCFLTLKGPANREDGIFSRLEIEEKLETGVANQLKSGFSLSEVDSEVTKPVLEKLGDLRVSNFLSFKNSRRVFDKDGFTYELDHSTCKDQELFELEAECQEKDTDKLKDLTQNWFSQMGWNYETSTEGKFSWAYRISQESSPAKL